MPNLALTMIAIISAAGFVHALVGRSAGAAGFFLLALLAGCIIRGSRP